MRVVIVSAVILIVIAPGCARRVPERAGGPKASPHVGWAILSGDAENSDRDVVCQSHARSECVVPADRPDARVLSHVHLYYHSASVETKYTGSVRIGFFDGAHELKPNMTVKAGVSPGNHSVSNFVSSKPGTYLMTIAVVATSVPSGVAQEIREQVSVTVR